MSVKHTDIIPQAAEKFLIRSCTHFIPEEFTGKKDPRYMGNVTQIYT